MLATKHARTLVSSFATRRIGSRTTRSFSVVLASLRANCPAVAAHGTTRFYSQTRPALRRYDDSDDEEAERIIIPGQKDIETINCDHMTQEEIEKIIEEMEERMKQEEEDKYVKHWKPGMRKRPLVMSYKLEDFEYELEPEKYGVRWTTRDKRSGALAIKVGMLPVFDTYGQRHPCTVLFLDKNIVLHHKTEEKHGYMAVAVAAGERKRKNVGVSVLGQYKSMPGLEDPRDVDGESPPWLVREFRVTDPEHLIPVNTRIHARHFVPGQAVDVAGISKGKGFQGGMKRHGFAGMPASHGVSKAHRALGSTGQCQDPGRVFKGKKMAGRMGGVRVTKQNLRVIKVDRGRNLVYVIGAVPGSKGQWVEIRDAIKRPLWKTDKVQDGVDRPPLPTFDFDLTVDGTGEPGHEEFMPLPKIDPTDPDYDELRREADKEKRASM